MEINSTESAKNQTAALNDKMFFTESIKSNLLTTARWSAFLAVLGYIGVGFIAFFGLGLLIGGYLLSGLMSDAGPWGATPGWAGIIYIAIAVLYFFMCMYLHRFSKFVKTAVAGDDQTLMEEGMKYQRKLYRLYGIVATAYIAIVVYAIILVISMGMAALI